MKTDLTYTELLAENQRLAQRVAYLERMLYGIRSDKLRPKESDNQPGLFDEILKEAMDEKAEQIKQTAEEIEQASQKRRQRSKKEPARPSKYRYAGLEERITILMPEGVDASECDVIGKDVARILHRRAAKVWVEVIERPILRAKADKNRPEPRIYQAKAPGQ